MRTLALIILCWISLLAAGAVASGGAPLDGKALAAMPSIHPLLSASLPVPPGPPRPLPPDASLGPWFKDDAHGFWIRVPDKWDFREPGKGEKHELGFWNGPRLKVKVDKIGRLNFPVTARIVWIERRPMGSITAAAGDDGKGSEGKGGAEADPGDSGEAGKGEEEDDEKKGGLTEAERRKLLAERNRRIRARTFDQWLTHFSGLTGVRQTDEKEAKYAKMPAREIEFLSKTNFQTDYKHLAVVIELSEFYELALIYSVVEPEYRQWRSFFRKCAGTLRITRPDKFAGGRADGESSSSRSGRDAKADEEKPLEDVVITRHGKVIEGKVEHDEKVCRIRLGPDAIEAPMDLVKEVIITRPEPFTPVTETEKEQAAKGYVKFKGRWMSPGRYELELKKEREKIRDKIDELKKHSDPADPWRRKTTRFVLETTTSEELLEFYTELFDAHIDAFEKRFKINVTKEAKQRKPLVRIFKDREEYLSFTKAQGTGGYFSSVDNTLNLFHNFEDPSLTEWVLLHEGTHLLNFLSNSDFAGRPHWIEEGTAEYFGSSKITRERNRITLEPGQILGNRLLLINERIETREVNTLRAALATHSYQYEDYAYWWSFVHFMIESKDYGKRFIRFYRDLYNLKDVKTQGRKPYLRVDPEDSVELFEKCLRIKDWVMLQAQWEQFIADHVHEVGGYGWMVLGRDLYNESFKKKAQAERARQARENDDGKSKGKLPEPPPEGQTQADLLARSLKALNRTIEEEKYEKAGAFYYRAMVLKELGLYDEALSDIDRTVALDPLNARYYGRRAVIRYLKENREEALRNMRIAVALDPLDLTLPLILAEMKAGSYVDLSR